MESTVSTKPRGRALHVGWSAVLLALCGLLLTPQAVAREPGKRRPALRAARQPSPVVGRIPGESTAVALKAPDSPLDVAGTLLLESREVSFDDVIPGVPTDRPGAVALRVLSDRRWSLRLIPDSQLTVNDGQAAVPVSRLSWRSGSSGSFAEFQGGRPVVVAGGAATGGAGQPVVVDLRLELADGDPLGWYLCNLRLSLEPE